MNDIWQLDIAKMLWTNIPLIGDVPEKRSNHSAIFYSPLNKYSNN